MLDIRKKSSHIACKKSVYEHYLFFIEECYKICDFLELSVNGENVSLMGHGDISVTLDTYTHIKSEDAIAEMERLDLLMEKET